MVELAPLELCTGCGACAFVCPESCIQMKENEIGIVFPIVDDTSCINCKRCQKVCPILKPVPYNTPQKAYAAWSADPEERRTSASGGVAAEIYKKALDQGMYAIGAVQNRDFSVTFLLTDQKDQLVAFKNSKYVFSSVYELFPKLKKLLASKNKAVVVGLPCQIAAIRKLFGKYNSDILLVDLVCHGVTPYRYLLQHIHKLESGLGQTAHYMSFRDPDNFTFTFTFTLYNNKKQCFYAKRTKDGDTYQFGYHRSISYRENCYHCKFACEERVSDITLSDYNGLGTLAPWAFPKRKVSCVLVHTDKGEHFITQLIQEGRLIAEERPVREPILADERLRFPSKKTSARKQFERFIKIYDGNFEEAMCALMPQAIREERIKSLLCLPQRVINKLFRIIKHL